MTAQLDKLPWILSIWKMRRGSTYFRVIAKNGTKLRVQRRYGSTGRFSVVEEVCDASTFVKEHTRTRR